MQNYYKKEYWAPLGENWALLGKYWAPLGEGFRVLGLGFSSNYGRAQFPVSFLVLPTPGEKLYPTLFSSFIKMEKNSVPPHSFLPLLRWRKTVYPHSFLP